MGSPDKSKLLKEMKATVNTLRPFIKKMGSNNTFKCENDKNKIIQFFTDKQDFKFIDIYEDLKYSHYFFFFELKDYYLELSLNFEYNFDSYEDLKNKSKVYITAVHKLDKLKTHSTSLCFSEFKEHSKLFLYVVDFFEDNKIYDQPNVSIKNFMFEQFKEAWFKDKEEFNAYVNYLKNKEFILLEILRTKNKFVEKRREINKKQKEGKLKNKSQNVQKIKNNENKIRELEREIKLLRKENEMIISQKYSPESYYEDKERLEYDYKLTVELFMREHSRELRKLQFHESFEMIFKL